MEDESNNLDNSNDVTPASPDANMSDKDDDEAELPPYYPAIMGCRSVSEFLCLNK